VDLIKPTTEDEDEKIILVEGLESQLRGSRDYDLELLQLRKTLSIHHDRHADDDNDHEDNEFVDGLLQLKNKVESRLDALTKDIMDLTEKVQAKEREWLAISVTVNDDTHGLNEAAWASWPTNNNDYSEEENPAGYKFDFFISYRVQYESALARELRIQMLLRNKRAYLDQEELADGEDWRNGFVAGLKYSRIVVPLVSKGCLDRMKSSNLSMDNVLLEWETAIAAMEKGFCLVVPVFIGVGEYDFSQLPIHRPSRRHLLPDELACRQSAFTTLSKLKRLDHLVLPDKEDGWPSSLIDALVQSLDVFSKIYEKTAIQRAKYYLSIHHRRLLVEEEDIEDDGEDDADTVLTSELDPSSNTIQTGLT
ncbi:hypothetical protein HK405_012407, partial [Cladochytrium tenue]